LKLSCFCHELLYFVATASHVKMEVEARAGPAAGQGGGKVGRGGARRGNKTAGASEVQATSRGPHASTRPPRPPARPHARISADSCSSGTSPLLAQRCLAAILLSACCSHSMGPALCAAHPSAHAPFFVSAAGPFRGRGAWRAWRERALRGQGTAGARREGSRGWPRSWGCWGHR